MFHSYAQTREEIFRCLPSELKFHNAHFVCVSPLGYPIGQLSTLANIDI